MKRKELFVIEVKIGIMDWRNDLKIALEKDKTGYVGLNITGIDNRKSFDVTIASLRYEMIKYDPKISGKIFKIDLSHNEFDLRKNQECLYDIAKHLYNIRVIELWTEDCMVLGEKNSQAD